MATELVPFLRRQLGDHAAAIRDLSRRTAEHAIEIGRRLTEAKRLLGHGRWGTWLADEFDWSERTAQRFMLVFERFKSVNLSEMRIGASALYLLASPSTPDKAVEDVLGRARNGHAVTVGEAVEVVAQTRQKTLAEATLGLPPEKRAAVLEAISKTAGGAGAQGGASSAALEPRSAKKPPAPPRREVSDSLLRVRDLLDRVRGLIEGLGPDGEQALAALESLYEAMKAVEG